MALAREATTATSAPLYVPHLPSSIFVRLKQSKVVVNNLACPFLLMSEQVRVWISSNGYVSRRVKLMHMVLEQAILQKQSKPEYFDLSQGIIQFLTLSKKSTLVNIYIEFWYTFGMFPRQRAPNPCQLMIMLAVLRPPVGTVPFFMLIMCLVYWIILHRSIGASKVFVPIIATPLTKN